MKSHISLTGLLVAALMFAVTVAMHEAARADGQTGSDYRGNSQWVCSSCAAAQGGSRLRANVQGSGKDDALSFRVEAALNEVTARAYDMAGADMTRATPNPNARARS